MLNPARIPAPARALVVLAIGASALAAQSGQAVRGNDTLLMKAYGRADLEWDVPMTTDAMFEVGSIAKQFAAVSILQLRDAGRLSLDDDITKWLPDLDTHGTKVTLRRMLDHTSGMETGEAGSAFDPRLTRDSAYLLLKRSPVRFKFPSGEAQPYNNRAFWLLGLVVEKAGGVRYEDYLQQKIFDPLGMKGSMHCNSSLNVPHRAHGYQFVDGVVRRPPAVVYALVFAPGAICSTAGDLVIWLTALHGGKVLSPRSYAENDDAVDAHRRIRNPIWSWNKSWRGLPRPQVHGHGGTAPGFRADATWYPDAQMAVVVLMNTSPASIPFSLEVTQTPTGLAFTREGAVREERLPWAGGLKFYAQENVTLTFRRANGDRGPVTELQRDDAGNLVILRKQRELETSPVPCP